MAVPPYPYPPPIGRGAGRYKGVKYPYELFLKKNFGDSFFEKIDLYFIWVWFFKKIFGKKL
jgi:hypothetical protein